jgi:hypothetical protein
MTSRTRTEIQSRAVKEGVFACPIAARTRRSLQSFVGDLFNMQEFFGLVVSAGFTHGNDPLLFDDARWTKRGTIQNTPLVHRRPIES